MPAAEVNARWDAFLAKIRERADEVFAQAEQGCAMLLELDELDPQPMTNAWHAVENQARELAARVAATWREKVLPGLEDAVGPAELAAEERKGEALRELIDRRKEDTGVRIFGDAARKILARAKENLGRPFRCTQCQAPLPVADDCFRSRHIACPYCANVNTFIPGTKVQAVEHFCCHHLARERTWELWRAWEAAEARMRADGHESLELMQAAEQALLEHTRAYLRAKAEVVPDLAKDFERDLAGRTAFFYEAVTHSPAWRPDAAARKGHA